MADDWLAFLGVNRDLMGGVSGGFVASLLERRPHFVKICIKTIVGGITAFYVSHSVQVLLAQTPPLAPFAEAAPYFVGLAGYAICHAAIRKVSNWGPIGGGKHDG